MYRSILGGTVKLALISTALTVAGGEAKAKVTPDAPKASGIPTSHYSGLEVSIGKPYAPLTIIMYYSLTCHHCHDFQEKVLPEIKAEFIDKGLVRFVFRDFPTDQLALEGAKIAWCRGKDYYLPIAKKLIATQDDWAPIDPAKLKDAEKALLKIAGEFAITTAEYRRCLANKDVEGTILRTSFEVQKTHQIKGAPAFLINGKVFGEDMTVKAIHKLLLEMGIHG